MADRNLLSIHSVQDQDIPFTKEVSRHGEIGYAFYRSAESSLNNIESQDYMVFRDSPNKFCFVICDGVGQSYFGQLAAELLGKYLFSWLEDLDVNQLNDRVLAGKLYTGLNDLTGKGQEMITEHKLPADMPDLQLMALQEEKKYGSEAVFLCGRIDFDLESKIEPPYLNLFWLGDVSFHIYEFLGKELDFPGQWQNKERWSTKDGVKGAQIVNYWNESLANVGKLVAHSDGIKRVSGQLFDLTNNPDEMKVAVENLYSASDSDDISLVAFDFNKPKKKRIKKNRQLL